MTRTRPPSLASTRADAFVRTASRTPPGWPSGPRRVANRRRRLPELLRAHDSIDTGAHVARRFLRLKDLPEHALYPQVHARLACGESPWSVARWLQAVVPDEDPYSAACMPLMTLVSRLRRYSALLPPAARIPPSYIDELTKGLPIQINVMAELAAAIVYQKQRISAFAEDEENLPMGMTSEQQRKEVAQLTDMLMKMLDAQIALGLVPANLAPQMNATGSVQGAGFDDDRLGADPFTRFLLDHPRAIPHVMSGIDRVVADLIEEQTMAAMGDDREGA